MTKLIIDRKKWLRGEGPSRLRRESDGAMCCLGFLGLMLGISENELTVSRTPVDCPTIWPEWIVCKPKEAPVCNTDAAGYMMDTNDTERMFDYEREERLKELFEPYIQIEFIG